MSGTITLRGHLGTVKNFNTWYQFLSQHIENWGYLLNEWIILIICRDIVSWRHFQHICVDKTILGCSWSYQPWWRNNFKTRGRFVSFCYWLSPIGGQPNQHFLSEEGKPYYARMESFAPDMETINNPSP